MPGGRKSGEVDALHLVRAVRHVKEAPVPPPPAPEAPPPPKPPPDPKTGGRYSHTAMPTKTEVLCYGCGYRFFATGKTPRLLCPKCRTELNQGDFQIEGTQTDDVKTVGRVHIGPDGILSGTTITARVICLEGRLEAAELHGYATIELGGKPHCVPEDLKTPHLVILEHASVAFKRKLHCHDLTVRGTLSGSVEAAGTVTIQAGGHLKGRLTTGHLVVEEGGGLTADCAIDAESFAPPPGKGRA
ncbi:MAG: polymer-forming cytoskeletal protein [Verrucomicrobia bacterium]|nr:polymer-forming cytoskeletal protein [Verrucomicrobiota bacterium]